jgi:hypothetical protein
MKGQPVLLQYTDIAFLKRLDVGCSISDWQLIPSFNHSSKETVFRIIIIATYINTTFWMVLTCDTFLFCT